MSLIRINRESQIPLIGMIHIGIIDRGSSLLQVRASTICSLQCTFCSTAANDQNIHPHNYEIELNYLLDWVKEAIRLKQNKVNQINIDSVGEPTSYQSIIELIKELKKLPEIKLITMQSNGIFLDKEKIKQLEKAGLNQINLSIHTLDENQAKELSGNPGYNLKKIIENCKLINKSKIELNLTPVYLPKINENGMENLIEFAKKLKCRISIQKYEIHKYSRKNKKAKFQNWYKFYKYLEKLEKKYDYKLKLGPIDFKICRSQKIPLEFKRGDKISAEVIMPGWIKNEVVAKANNRAITIINCNSPMNSRIKIKILNTKDGIYIAKKI